MDFVFQMDEVPTNINLTAFVQKWMRTADPKLVKIAISRFQQLAEGPQAWKRSKVLSKVLQGQDHTPAKYPLREAKLDSGFRIMWQERKALESYGLERGSVLIWEIGNRDLITKMVKKLIIVSKVCLQTANFL